MVVETGKTGTRRGCERRKKGKGEGGARGGIKFRYAALLWRAYIWLWQLEEVWLHQHAAKHEAAIFKAGLVLQANVSLSPIGFRFMSDTRHRFFASMIIA